METFVKRNFKDVFWELLVERTDGNQMKFSIETGIPVTTVNGWLRGNRLPRLEQLTILGDYFDVSLDYLTGRVPAAAAVYDEKSKISPKRNRLKRRIETLGDEQLTLTEDFLDFLDAVKTIK